ncbi:uncharacterized protein LOC62_04G006479 [Vanrija pseudolonga]|uniref:Uncharacterized protein n=1 Tax=Vanrija pseudolonga TaxID=143232 RepID=A0AAF0YDT9_9TREE|nr:hypothetical protein LOC62_04G006479 [Vanrija pseudolonga]
MIDHTAHPTIIDAIIAHSSARTWRGVSKGYTDRVTRPLLRHAELEAWPADGADDGEPTFHLIVADTRCGRPANREFRLPFAPQYVEVLSVDFPSFLRSFKLPDAIAAQFTALRTLKRTGRSASRPDAVWPGVTTYVDYFDAANSDAGANSILLPPGVERYVLHLRWDRENEAANRSSMDITNTASIQHAVLVVWPSMKPRVATPVGDRRPPACLLTALRLGADVLARGGSFTVVGAERIHPDQLGVAVPAGYSMQFGLRECADAVATVVLSLVPGSDAADFDASRLRLCTYFDWRTEISSSTDGRESKGGGHRNQPEWWRAGKRINRHVDLDLYYKESYSPEFPENIEYLDRYI